MKLRGITYILGCGLLAASMGFGLCRNAGAEKPPQLGPISSGGYLIPTKQLLHPAGKSLEFSGRPVDLILSADGKTLYAEDNSNLLVIDTDKWVIRQRIGFPESGSSMHGMALNKKGTLLYVSTAANILLEANISKDGTASWGRKIVIPGPNGDMGANACLWGLTLSQDDETAYVCLSRNNTLGVVDLKAGKLIKEIPVGIAPYDVVLSKDGNTAYVSNWGGRHPKKGERTAQSSGTDTLVDARGVTCSGTVSLVDLKQGREISQMAVGLHPSDIKLTRNGKTLYVANANSDTVSVIDVPKWKVSETIKVRPNATLPFGSAPNALTLSNDEKTLFVANGGNNAIAEIALSDSSHRKSKIKGFIPTAWYPGAVTTDGKNLYIANVKGLGARGGGPNAKKREIYQHLGTITKVAIPSAALLKKYTAQVNSDSQVPQILRSLERTQSTKQPVPVPAHFEEPSVFDHVVYIIKENKTYDQVLGDCQKGNSDPDLCIYGKDVSPNHHALADQFVLLDNYYCNGVCSADGHSWVTEGNVTDYLEKSFGGMTRAYSFGDDSLTFSSSGMIWNNVLEHGLSFRNYGEMDSATPTSAGSWNEIYQDYLKKTDKFTFDQYMPNDTLREYSCRQCPGWNLSIPDAIRADAFLREFKDYEKKGSWPNFVIIYLPDDHTSGGAAGYPTPKAQVADNDLALGRVIEGISKSMFWPKTCIFVIEDDPQSGFDHVDGHRSFCLIASPYTKRNALISQFYNQTAVIHTMENILGIPPMNQMDAMAPLMTECFTNKPNFTPYTCLPNIIPLDQTSQKAGLAGSSLYRAGADQRKLLEKPDQMDDDLFNRAIWESVKGPYIPYPAEYAGPHGKGLAALHLALTPDNGIDDDDD